MFLSVKINEPVSIFLGFGRLFLKHVKIWIIFEKSTTFMPEDEIKN